MPEEEHHRLSLQSAKRGPASGDGAMTGGIVFRNRIPCCCTHTMPDEEVWTAVTQPPVKRHHWLAC